MKINVELKLIPFVVPEAVLVDKTSDVRAESINSASHWGGATYIEIPLSSVPRAALIELCAEFTKQVLAAGEES